MFFAMLQCLGTPGYMKDFHFGLRGRVLGCSIGNELSLSILVHPAQFYTMGHDHESMALNTFTVSDSSRPSCVLLQKNLSSRGVDCHNDVSAF